MKIIHHITFLCICSLAGCAGRAPEACPLAFRQSPRETLASAAHADEGPASLDDRRLNERICAEGVRLMQAGQTVKSTALIAQLDKPSCRLKLAASANQAISPQDLYTRVKSGVLVIAGIFKCPKCGNWHAACASGFAIASSGAIITSYHVLNAPDRETIVAMTADGKVLPVKSVLAASKTDDVAILRVDAADLSPLALAAAPVGSRIHVISHPDNHFYMLTDGMIARYHNALPPGRPSMRMDITADYAKGSSGGPVFDSYGSVVGLVAATNWIYADETNGHQHLQMVIHECIPAAAVLKLIEQ